MSWVAHNHHWFDQYVRSVADLMGLKDWKINIDDDQPRDEDAGASCEVIYGRKIARFRFSTPSSPEELRHFVVHELLHCHSALVDWNANSLSRALGQQAYDVWHGGFEDAIELMIDGIAMAWAEMLPLPTHEINMPRESQDRPIEPEEVSV